jgi:hypothetical protein
VAKKVRKDQNGEPQTAGQAAPNAAGSAAQPAPAGESNSTYFRRLFKKMPRLLKERSNKLAIDRWLADHPGETTASPAVRNALANVKGDLRRRKRKRKKQKAARSLLQPAAAQPVVPHAPRTSPKRLEVLEVKIDECMMLAREIDPVRLENVYKTLRHARNEVVWIAGESR